jgi:hypothetical protein
LTLAQQKSIQQLPVQKAGSSRRDFQAAKTIKNWAFVDDIDTVIKEFADEHCKKILAAIMKGELKPHPTLADMDVILSVVMGANYHYRSPVVLPPPASASPAWTRRPSDPNLKIQELFTLFKTQSGAQKAAQDALQEKLQQAEEKLQEQEKERARHAKELAALKAQRKGNEAGGGLVYADPLSDKEAQRRLEHLEQNISQLKDRTEHVSHAVTRHDDVLHQNSQQLAEQQADVQRLERNQSKKGCCLVM